MLRRQESGVKIPTLVDRRKVENGFVCGEVRNEEDTLQSFHDYTWGQWHSFSWPVGHVRLNLNLRLPKPVGRDFWKNPSPLLFKLASFKDRSQKPHGNCKYWLLHENGVEAIQCWEMLGFCLFKKIKALSSLFQTYSQVSHRTTFSLYSTNSVLYLPGGYCEELQAEPLFRISDCGLLAIPLNEDSGNQPAGPDCSPNVLCASGHHLKTHHKNSPLFRILGNMWLWRRWRYKQIKN